MKENRLTNYELALWLAKGNGQKISDIAGKVSTHHSYNAGDFGRPVKKRIKVRKWGDKIWTDPTTDYCGVENVEGVEISDKIGDVLHAARESLTYEQWLEESGLHDDFATKNTFVAGRCSLVYDIAEVVGIKVSPSFVKRFVKVNRDLGEFNCENRE